MDEKGQDMGKMKPKDATKICEAVLREERRYNVAHKVSPGETVIIDRMLARQVEILGAYAEVCDKLSGSAVRDFFGLLLSTATVWSPEKIRLARAARDRLQDINQAIAKQAAALAALCDERDALHNRSGFYGTTHGHIVEVIAEASLHNGFYQSYVRQPLQALSGQFDMKYWPSLGGVLRVLARDAGLAEIEAADPMTEASTRAARPSRADFFKALFAAMEQARDEEVLQLPNGFMLSDATLASLANVVLDLGKDELVDAAYVKRLRQRDREAEKLPQPDLGLKA